MNPSGAPVTVPNTAHHSLEGLSANLKDLLDSFSNLRIEGEPAPTDLSPPPPCPISEIPDEILSEILLHLAIIDLPSFARLAQVCKRLAYLVTTEDRIWKRIALGPEQGFAAMHYDFACQVDGKPLGDDGEGGYVLGSDESDDILDAAATKQPDPVSLTPLLVPAIYPTYRALFRHRPRLRFNGAYISTVNYTRPGASSPTSISWNSPIHIVTYYRYLRFLRDGTVISLLTTSEPPDVVPYLHLEHVHKNHGGLPSAPMKDAVIGRWRLSGPTVPGDADGEMIGEKEGVVHVETAGATPKYLYKMVLLMGSAGRGARNNKLNWQGYWSYNKLTDDWATFMMKNDRHRPFYWSRVRSWGIEG
jgi:F-box protein 9